MTAENLMSHLSDGATVIGYVVLLILAAALCWFTGALIENWRYKLMRKRKHDREWDSVRSAWLLDMQSGTVVYDIADRIKTDEYPAVSHPIDRIDTDVLHQTISEIEHYQKEHNPHDA